MNLLEIEISDNAAFYVDKYSADVLRNMKYYFDFFSSRADIPPRIFVLIVLAASHFDNNYPLAEILLSASGDFPRASGYVRAIIETMERQGPFHVDTEPFEAVDSSMLLPRADIED